MFETIIANWETIAASLAAVLTASLAIWRLKVKLTPSLEDDARLEAVEEALEEVGVLPKDGE